tara:strand:+ start:21826 stop:23148 length:1323 start_codon:yes stop_codon:yes gene_type:complete
MNEKQFTRNFIKYIGQDFGNKKFLLAVSGGIDSMVLTHLFHKNQLNFAVAHCNFKLRKNDSDEDEKFIHDFCSKHHIPFYVKSFDTEKFAKENRLSVQMAARELRYQFFFEILETENFDYLATAHHANDQAETILSNLIRGTGIDGLKGMLFLQNNIFRPLLSFTKSELTAFAKNNNIAWREDSSNASIKYKRNAIRHKIIPGIEKLNPAFIENILSFSEKMMQTQTIYFEKITEEKKQYFKEENKIIYIDKSFDDELESPTQYLFEWIKPYGFNYTQSKEILASIAKTGRLFYSENYILTIDRKQLIISAKENSNTNETHFKYLNDLQKAFEVQLIDKPNLTSFHADPKYGYFDLGKITFPLMLRTWQAGDKFKPFGMKGFKKLSDFFVDEKIPRNDKNCIPVLTDANDNIIWICGFRTDDRFKISDKTKKILLLKMIN